MNFFADILFWKPPTDILQNGYLTILTNSPCCAAWNEIVTIDDNKVSCDQHFSKSLWTRSWFQKINRKE